MDIRQFRVVIRARNFDRSCQFYGETLALPSLGTWEGNDLRGARFETGFAVLEVVGRAEGLPPGGRDESFDYQGPAHKLALTFVVPSAQKAYEELHFRQKNIPGGLTRDADGTLVFETHDPDGVRILYRQAEA